MKNELTGSHQSLENMSFQSEFNLNALSKIRKHTYFLIARFIKFGLNIPFLMVNCQLSQRIIRDVSNHENNCFIFENLSLLMLSLSKCSEAVVEMVGDHYETLIDVIYEIKDHHKRNSLLKVLISLIMEASEHLSYNRRLFQRVFAISKDQRSDQEMVESILWMATCLSEQHNNPNFNLILGCMLENQILLIIWKSLSSNQERIIL